MKFTKIIFPFVLLIVLCYHGYSQAVINFEHSNFDFGQVAEGTIATHEFRFKNEGDAPLIISNVQASCGCTTPYWTKDPVKPGEEGVITASYNSNGRPGSFNKSITITSNAAEPSARVFIKGTVVSASQAKVYSEEDLKNSPKISVDRKIINLGKVEAGQSVPVKITVENSGKNNLVISDLRTACHCIQMGAESSSIIHPGKQGTIHLIYRAKETGKKAETAVLLSNDLNTPETKVIIHADVVENLSNTSILKENQQGFSF